MTRRTERLASLIRGAVAEAILTKLADPRVDPARVSVTRVTVGEDLLSAKVFISVIGSEADERKVLRAVRSAAGHFQGAVAAKARLRHTPRLTFETDQQLKKTQETIDLIQQATRELPDTQ